ncbi:MAG: VWA-like domain-containing protein [Roseburia sp.]|nr:VWA-like domain-containing protein [Roseburia sp.]
MSFNTANDREKEKAMAHVQTQSEWETEMSVKVLTLIRNEIYMELRFLDAALSALVWREQPSLQAFACDGGYLYFSPEQLLRVFKKNPKFLSRAFLHTTLHCVFSHLWLRAGRERARWDAACDIMVELVIDQMGKDCTRRPLSWLRKKTYDELEKEKIVSAAGIYRYLGKLPEEYFEELRREFFTDSHQYWPEQENETPQAAQARQMWDKISRQSRMEMEKRGREPDEGEELLAKELKSQKSQRSYREFLRKFAVLREEVHCDPDEYDMNYYTYGLRVYGNMPLLEPLESREVMKIQEFVVVLDTSYSTDGELVKNFLRETFGILTQADSFFRKCHIRILQCDDAVRMDEKVTDTEDMERLLSRFTLAGGGGTDFRPAFAYIDELRRSGEMKQLQGVLYFTDGKGIYPSGRPDYDTAFLFLDDYEEERVPPWAMRLRLLPEEFLTPKLKGKDK